jgi:hypothetical protein
MLALANPAWARLVSVAYVMAAQSLSGIAKDLTKMSAKSTLKLLVPENRQSSLFKWVAVLTGSKNALKGVGFFLGGLLLAVLGYAESLYAMAGALVLVLIGAMVSLPRELGKSKAKSKFKRLLSKTREVNLLSGARFFLFGPRYLVRRRRSGFSVSEPGLGLHRGGDIPRSLGDRIWSHPVAAPLVISRWTGATRPTAAPPGARLLSGSSDGAIAVALAVGQSPHLVILGGLALFAVVFAINSSVHSYLILAYSDGDKVAMNVGFYYMANAGGRLAGTLLSGMLFQWGGSAPASGPPPHSQSRPALSRCSCRRSKQAC